ncbi:polyprenyl synthetase family protein [Psychrobacter sp. UBA3962]|uniref:polyprenyl synthetase family protein n=1 Tax=Psychrobacter sp. UBA3962 TaxID=1947352 RepID=UPI0025FFE2AE|nr:farnesyl diphosphate synthase [Psychrobacter sp. UBA3962]
MIKQPVSFENLSQQVIATLEADIESLLSHANLPSPLQEACYYAMTGQGKRVRPLMVACGYQTVLQGETETADNKATKTETSLESVLSDNCRRAMLAVEFVHTYSLIHDDLPCMDDDDLRRGRPTCHIKFDEATAMLAGDVLQTLAFEALTADIEGFAPISEVQAAQLLTVLAPRARRMVSGQMLDLNAENKQITQAELEAIHRDKTGALIEAAVLMGGVCAEATADQLGALTQFATNIGLAFQVQDDILDVTASTDILGKPAGSDEGLNKSTYVRLMGVETARDYAKSLFDEGKQAIVDSFGQQSALTVLADWLWQRQK